MAEQGDTNRDWIGKERTSDVKDGGVDGTVQHGEIRSGDPVPTVPSFFVRPLGLIPIL